jgi:hypothetical protein
MHICLGSRGVTRWKHTLDPKVDRHFEDSSTDGAQVTPLYSVYFFSLSPNRFFSSDAVYVNESCRYQGDVIPRVAPAGLVGPDPTHF